MQQQTNSPARRAEFAGYAALRGAVDIIEHHRGAPSPEMMRALATQVRSAYDQIMQPDPVRERIEFVLLAIRQSTRATSTVILGRQRDTVTVTDNHLYSWAITEIHRLGAGDAPNPPAGDEE